jgi:hypothetical protein
MVADLLFLLTAKEDSERGGTYLNVSSYSKIIYGCFNF